MSDYMTFDEFLRYLSATNLTWDITTVRTPHREVHSIRSTGHSGRANCPITAVCELVNGKVYDLCRWGEASIDLHMRRLDAEMIVRAADQMPGYNDLCRIQLEKACRLIPSVEVSCESVSMNLEPTLC
mgnify:CR=1 FL=1